MRWFYVHKARGSSWALLLRLELSEISTECLTCVQFTECLTCVHSSFHYGWSELEYLPAICSATCSSYSPLVGVLCPHLWNLTPHVCSLVFSQHSRGSQTDFWSAFSLLPSPFITYPTHSTPCPQVALSPQLCLGSLLCAIFQKGSLLGHTSPCPFSPGSQPVVPCVRQLLHRLYFLTVHSKKSRVVSVSPSWLGQESHHICIQTLFLSLFSPLVSKTFQCSDKISFNSVFPGPNIEFSM